MGKGINRKKPTKGNKKVGGKNLSLYMNQGFNLNKKTLSRRRFSLVDSSSDSESSDNQNNGSDSDSDLSLTAVSDNELSDKSSVFAEEKKGKRIGGRGKGKSIKAYGKTIQRKYWSDSEEDEEEEDAAQDDDDDEEDEEEFDSSSDDENVDFVKLQAQKRVRSNTPVERKRKDSTSIPKPKFGRRRSTAALPEDINFTLEFDDSYNDNAIADSDAEVSDDNDDFAGKAADLVINTSLKNTGVEIEDEDLGEEIEIPEVSVDQIADLDFNNQIIQAPKFNDDDINSDDDYEIDDNELLATLQADNDLEEFNKSGVIRHNSIISADEEDDDEKDFLKEEEKFLVNEFENNGFDDEQEDEISNDPITFISDDEEEEEDDEEVIDFTLPDDIEDTKKYPKKSKKVSSDSEEDDSYLWNYFFSSDNESDTEIKNEKSPVKQKVNSTSFIAVVEDDQEYDSSESTDVDLNIPANSTNSLGSQKAKEVLSSKTADYRPPILGTWITLESKPFGIIDGLSTRSLSSAQSPNIHRNVDRDRFKPRRSIVGTPHSDDSALGLDDLLNMSELDYDDTDDARIWRDFNNSKKRVPLGAFRNKSLLQNSLNHSTEPLSSNVSYNHTSKTNNEFNQRRYSLSNHKVNKPRRKSNAGNNVPSKLKRRRASIVEAFAEGYRPTKSGLFSEQALIDVEEVLGDDNDIMALIKGL